MWGFIGLPHRLFYCKIRLIVKLFDCCPLDLTGIHRIPLLQSILFGSKERLKGAATSRISHRQVESKTI